jgi:hypothetical protein
MISQRNIAFGASTPWVTDETLLVQRVRGVEEALLKRKQRT